MKCLLCKGKGSFLVHKKENNSDCYESEFCPRCKGTGYEITIGKLNERTYQTFKTYSEHYSKYFEEKIPQHHNEILKKL